jgi:hypothetical protein
MAGRHRAWRRVHDAYQRGRSASDGRRTLASFLTGDPVDLVKEGFETKVHAFDPGITS